MALKYSGYAVWAGVESDHKKERDSVRCAHCQFHYFVEPGSGKTRGFCLKCMQPTCGAEACLLCIPFEEKMIRQARRRQLFRSMGLKE